MKIKTKNKIKDNFEICPDWFLSSISAPFFWLQIKNPLFLRQDSRLKNCLSVSPMLLAIYSIRK